MILIAKEGFTKGRAWAIGERPLVMGRAAECDIVLNDLTVSRKHCAIVRKDDGIYLRDLNSRNPVLLNGRSAAAERLEPGDVLSVGNALFIVAEHATPSLRSPAPHIEIEEDTQPIHELGSVSAFREASAARYPTRQADYVLLYELGLALGDAPGFAGVVTTIQEHLAPRFPGCHLALFEDSSGGLEALWPYEEAAPPGELRKCIKATIAEGVQQRFNASTPGKYACLTAPFKRDWQSTGAAVLISKGPTRIFTDDDVVVFGAMVRLLAAGLHSADRTEALLALNERLAQHDHREGHLVGESEAMNALRRELHTVGVSGLNALVVGETGTGKELAARAIHAQSSCSEMPFVVVNCAALPDELLESELFGHTKGAFTGANHSREGLLQLADGGTLFLDEIGDLSPANQAAVLRVIENGVYRALGSLEEQKVNIRYVAATSRELNEKNLRMDLYHRLAGFVVQTPPLRDRPSDINALSRHFLDKQAARSGAIPKDLETDALALLIQHDWPGNVRELQNVIERAAAFAGSCAYRIDFHHVQKAMGHVAPEQTANVALASLRELEQNHIELVLDATDGNMTETAKILGISKSTLYLKTKKYGLKSR